MCVRVGQVEDSAKRIKSKNTSMEEGWMTKFQVANEECIPWDHPLLSAFLAELPTRKPSRSSMRDAGEMEYYYKSRSRIKSTDGKEQSLTLTSEVKVGDKEASLMLEGFDTVHDTTNPPHKALEDSKVKSEPLGDTSEKLEEDVRDVMSKLRKTSKTMNEFCYDAMCTHARLTACTKEKPYMQHMADNLKDQLDIFTRAKDKVINNMTRLSAQEGDKTVFDEATALVDEANVHCQAFKCSVLQDAKLLLRG